MSKDSDEGRSVITIKNIIYIGFSLLLLVLPYCLYVWMNGQGPSDLGTLYGAACGFLAVLWFYRGFRLQSLQINEQKKQFLQQMHIQHQDSLLDFLITSSERTERQLKNMLSSLNLTEIHEVSVLYIKSIKYYELAFKSSDPDAVQTQITAWLKIETPCVKFISSVRDVIILYKRRLGFADDFEGVDPAEYVLINGTHLMSQPFISAYKGNIELLAKYMYTLRDQREAMMIASIGALQKTYPDMMKKEHLIELIEKAQKKKGIIPKICDGLYEENSLTNVKKN